MKSKTESLLSLASAFRASFDDATIQFMLDLLDDVTDAEMEQACRRAGRTCKFMPTVAEMRDLVLEDRAANPTQRTSKKPMTRSQWLSICTLQDQQELQMTEEEYEKFKADYKSEHGEEWAPPGWNPDEWNEDGTPKDAG